MADWRLLSHHVIGLVGIALQLRRSVGGGMMVRLLLDVLTDFAQFGREWITINRRQFGAGEVPWPFAIAFAFLRLVSDTATTACAAEAEPDGDQLSCCSFFPLHPPPCICPMRFLLAAAAVLPVGAAARAPRLRGSSTGPLARPDLGAAGCGLATVEQRPSLCSWFFADIWPPLRLQSQLLICGCNSGCS